MFDASLPQSMYGLLPNVKSCTLYLKTAAGDPDTYASGLTVNARRRPANQDEINRANLSTADEIITWSILDDGTDDTFSAPTPESKLVDDEGVSWKIKDVKATVLETIYVCVCVRMWPTA